MYRIVAFSCFVAVVFGGCGKDGWKTLTTCLQPTIQKAKTTMEEYKAKMVDNRSKIDACLKSASCVWPVSAASQQPAPNASLMISCFKRHFTIVDKIEACAQQKVTDFAMPDFDQLGADIDSNGGFAQEAENMKSSFVEMTKDSKCDVKILAQCYKDVAGGGMSGPQGDPMCGEVKTCFKSSFINCDLNNTMNVLCACTTQILNSTEANELTDNAPAFLQCINRRPQNETAAKKAFRPMIEKKIHDIFCFNLDKMCGSPKPQIQLSAAANGEAGASQLSAATNGEAGASQLSVATNGEAGASQLSAAVNGEAGASVIGKWRTG